MQTPAAPHSLFRPNENCRSVEAFGHFAALIDGEAYFAALDAAFAQARRRIVIVGWDFNSQIRLRPQQDGSAPLGEQLRALVESRPELEIYALIWRNSIFYGANVDIPLSLLPRWSDHPRIHFKLDDTHPFGACHHQKIVCIDDGLAFVGGIDLTQGRWDTPDHLPEHILRQKDDGEPYRPVHDVQAMFDGAAAREVARIAAERWETAGGEPLTPLPGEREPIWPASVKPLLTDHAAAIARTLPAQGAQPEIAEIRALNEAMLVAARRSIYIESQYFALPEVAEILAWQLGRAEGPDVVLAINQESSGLLEQYVMANNRDRMFALLKHADRHGRLRCYHPVSCPDPECQIKAHSKLMIVDDRYLRIGSSNFNARSLGLDTECDIAIEGSTPEASKAIARLQAELLGEHLGVSPTKFAVVLARSGSLIDAIETLNGGPRRFKAYPDLPPETEMTLAPGSSLLDPDRPIDLAYLWDKLTSPSAY